MNNTRFATTIHILTLMAHLPDEWLQSDFIASSIQINPVIVRKELGILQEAGVVESRKGKNGGSKLRFDSKEILLKDIYLLVKNEEILGKKNKNPNPECVIGKKINQQLESLFFETDQLVSEFLRNKTLAEFVHQFE